MMISYEQREHFTAEARRLRAQAMADAVMAVGRGVIRLGSALVRVVREWHERATLASELYGMSEHELSDIGLSRCDVDAVVDGAYRGEARAVRRRPLLVRVSPDIRRVKVARITREIKAA